MYIDYGFFDSDEVPSQVNLCFSRDRGCDSYCMAMFSPPMWQETTKRCVFYEKREHGDGCAFANFYTGCCTSEDAAVDKNSIRAMHMI